MVFYKKPMLSAVLLNTTSCFIAISSINADKYLFLSPLILSYFFNKKILIKGENLNKRKVMFIYLTFMLGLLTILAFNKYFDIFGIVAILTL